MAVPRVARDGSSVERVAWVTGVAFLYLVGYFTVGWAVDPDRARSLALPLDRRVPFLPSSIFVYASVFPAAFLPVFVVRCPLLFRRVARAYAGVITLSLLCFVIFPVSSAGLRPATVSPPGDLATWGVQLLYSLDPAVNLFPSLHLSLAVLAALCAHAAAPAVGRVAIGWSLFVAISILTVKQHFAVDAVAGAALGAAAYAALVHPGVSERSPQPAYGWRGPALLLALSGAALLGFCALYLSGWLPPVVEN